jgi:hypothetical protein
MNKELGFHESEFQQEEEHAFLNFGAASVYVWEREQNLSKFLSQGISLRWNHITEVESL